LKAKVAELAAFGEPLQIKEYDLPPPDAGEVLVRITASGVCGSDAHIWAGEDPRIALPLTLGHEGVGDVVETGGEVRDVSGAPLLPGDPVAWDRGTVCGVCPFCTRRDQEYLCPDRLTYGITRDGCFASHILLDASTKLIKLSGRVDPASLCAAMCSGATAAHAVGECRHVEGEVVVVQGPGPLGLFASALLAERGAAEVVVIGTGDDRDRLALASGFGATHAFCTDDSTPEERRERIWALGDGCGPRVVVNAACSAASVEEGIALTARGGEFALPGAAVPVREVCLRPYEDVVLRNIHITGVWVSGTSHLRVAVDLVEGGRYPFEKLLTHRFGLEQATDALRAVAARQAIKAVIIPEGEKVRGG